MILIVRTVLQTGQSLPPTERRHQSYQVSEGEGEGDQHQGEDEAEEKEPNVEFLFPPSSETETTSCIYFTGFTGPLYPDVLRGGFLRVTSNCLTLMYSLLCLPGPPSLGGERQTHDGPLVPPPALAGSGHHLRDPPGGAPHHQPVQALLHLHQAPHSDRHDGGRPGHVLSLLCQRILWVSPQCPALSNYISKTCDTILTPHKSHFSLHKISTSENPRD